MKGKVEGSFCLFVCFSYVAMGNPEYYSPYPLMLVQYWKSPDAWHLLVHSCFLVHFQKSLVSNFHDNSRYLLED